MRQRVSVRSRLRTILRTCARKGVRYWVLAAAFAVAGGFASHALDGVTAWRQLKYDAYILVQNMRGGPRRVPQVVLVAIDDAEYYGPELAGRKPLKRDYLARLVTRIAAARPRLVALDVDFRSPAPDGNAADFDDYRAEDEALVTALCAAQAETRLVISTAVYADAATPAVAEPNVYDGVHGPCGIPGGRIAAGYLALPVDLRRVPLSVRLKDGSLVDSFALAIARVLAPQQYPDAIELERLPFGRFYGPAEFTRIEAGAVLAGTADARLEDRIVLVYGDWHVLAKDRGSPMIDTFTTPIGTVGGAFVHANLVETLLAAEYTAASPDFVAFLLEGAVALWLAVAFAFPTTLLRKLGYLGGTAAVLFVAAWLSFQVFAVFFDILPLLAAMYLHAVADQVNEWREAAHGHAGH